MPEAVGILNSFTGGLQNFATALRNQDGAAQALLAGTSALGIFAGAKAVKGIWDLATAGTSLKEAAAALKAAATTMNGGKDSAVVAGDKSKLAGEGFGRLGAMFTGFNFLGALFGGPTNLEEWEQNRQKNADYDRAMNDWLGERNLAPAEWLRPGGIYQTALEEMERRQQMERLTTPYNPNTPGVGSYFGHDGIDPTTTGSTTTARPDVDMSSADAALQKAGAIGSDIANALSVSARPIVDTGALDVALQKANALVSILSRVGPLMQQAAQRSNMSVSRAMNRNFTDQGVTP